MLCFRCGSPVSDAAQTCTNCGQDLSSQAAPNPEQFAELQKKLRETGREQRRPAAAYDIGEVVAERYEINDVVGMGAVGTVYKAFDQESEVDVALKVISGEHLPSEEARNHFLLALQRARDVVHDNAVRYFDVDHDGQRCFYVMQFLKGLPLRKILDMRRAKGQRFSVAEVEPIFVQLCRALDDTSAIMVHGGLKPENIIILPDLLKITDFGLAEVLPREAFLAAQRQYKDALHYIAPEVVARADYDVRADIYSVGVILVELLTGRVYTGEEPVAIHVRVEEIPPAVDEVLRRAVSPDPEQRQETPGQLSAELAEALGVKGVVVPGAVEPGTVEPPEPPPDDEEETTSRARLQTAAELAADDDVATGEIESPELALERPDYSDPLVPPPKKSGSQVTHQLGIDDIEMVSQSGPVALTDGLGPDEDEDILTAPPAEVEERTARVDPDQMQEQVTETEEELRLSRPEGPPPERTQQIDADMILEGEGAEEEDAEQVLLVPPGDINHSQVSGETDSDPTPEAADEPSYKPLSANLSQKVLSQDSINKEARAREALQAFDFDATLQEAVEKAHQVEPDTSGSGAVPLPKGEPEARPNVVTSEAALSARGTLEVPAAPAPPPVDEDEGQTMVVAQEAVADQAPTNRLLPTLIVAFIVVLAAGTAGAIYYVSSKRSADALQELERKRAAALALVKDAAVKQVISPDTGPAVAALPLREDATPSAAPDSAVSAPEAPSAPPPPPPAPTTPRPTPKQALRPAVAKAQVPRPRPPAPRVAQPPPPPPPAPAPEPKASAGKCPAGMRHITGRGGGEGYCIDSYEYPGRGRVPQRAGLQAATAACRARGLRLCTAKEWIRACGGLFPYGRAYNAKRCNTGGSAPAPAGSRPGCRSRWGLFDMSGNVSEWVSDGVAMGGDASSEQGHAGCLARTGGGGLTGFRCCGDPEWD